MATEVLVRSEDDAWEVFDRALRATVPADLERVRFEGWPSLEIHVEGPRWDASVPTRVMPAILEYQAQVYRGYCKSRYGTWDTRKLTAEERDYLEIVVRVKKGSSLYESPLYKTLNRLVEAGIDKMDPSQIIMLAVSLGLVMVSPIIFKTWMNGRFQEKELDARVALSKEETARAEIMAKAIRQSGDVAVIEQGASEARNKVIKSLAPTDQLSIGGASIDGEEAQAIARRPRELA